MNVGRVIGIEEREKLNSGQAIEKFVRKTYVGAFAPGDERYGLGLGTRTIECSSWGPHEAKLYTINNRARKYLTINRSPIRFPIRFFSVIVDRRCIFIRKSRPPTPYVTRVKYDGFRRKFVSNYIFSR